MATLARLNVILGLSSGGFASGLDKAQAKLKKFGRNMDAAGRRMTSSLTVPMVAVGVAAVKMSLDFDVAMTKIITLVGVSEEQVKEWSSLLLTLGPQLGKTPTELANALFAVTSAGYRGAEAIDVLTYAAKGSNIGLGDTLVVADAVTSAINAYGKENLNAADATAILRAAVQKGKAEADSIAPVLGNVVGVAAAMGVEFHETAAAIAAMTLQGVPAEIAVTQLSAILSTMQKGSEQTRKGLRGIGTDLDEMRGVLKEKGLIGLLTTLVEKFGDNEDAAAAVFGNVRALRGLYGLVGKSAEENIQIFADLAKVTGEDLNDGLAIVAKNSGFHLNQVFAQLASSAITLGDAILPVLVPAAQKLAEGIALLTEKFSGLDPQVQKVVLGILGLAAVAGPVLIVVGLVASGLAAISLSVVGWGVAIAGAGVLIAKNWEKVRAGLDALLKFAAPALDEFRALAVAVFARIKEFALDVWPAIQEIVAKVVATIVRLWTEHGDAILTTVKRAWLVAKNIILGSLEILLGAVEAFIHVLNGDWPKAWETVKTSATKVFDTIGRVVGASLLRMQSGFYELASAAGVAIAQILAKIRDMVLAWMSVPFIGQAGVAVGNTALAAIDLAMAGIVNTTADAKAEADKLNTAADDLLGPLQKAEQHLVQMQSGWITVELAATKAAEQTSISIKRAGEDIQGSLKGGFGRGVQEGAEEAKQTYQSLQQWVADHPLRPELDLEYLQRQWEQAGLAPNTGGSLP